jgi:hypothetical protein
MGCSGSGLGRIPPTTDSSRDHRKRTDGLPIVGFNQFSQSPQCDAVRRVSEVSRRVGEGVNESFGPIVPAVPASILFFARDHVLTRVETRLTAMSERIMRLSAAAGRS